MRVALVTTEFGDAIEGGAGVYASSLAHALTQQGIDLTVLGPSQQQETTQDGLVICPVAPGGSGLVKFWFHLPMVYRRAVRSGTFEVIHGNGIAAVPLLLGHRRTAHVTTVHHVTRDLIRPGGRGAVSRLRDLRGETGIVPIAESVLVHKSDFLIADSRATSDSLLRHYPSARGKVGVIHLGVPIHHADIEPRAGLEMRQRWVHPDESLLLAVGRLEPRKGLDVLFKAIAALSDSTPPFRLVVVGAGPIDAYQSLAAQLGCADRVRLVGWLASQDLAAAYQACDIFVMPSRHEGFGLAAMEAMAAGKPVVVTRTGAALDGIIDDSCGAVVEPGNVEALTRALRFLLSDPSAAGIGARNRARLGQLSWEATATATISAYERALRARG